MTGIILAGGENRRMGRNKAFLEVGGVPMIERVLRPLREVFRDIVIVTNEPRLYTVCEVKIVTDVFETRGPLTGIYSGLLGAADDFGFVVACDMPYLNSRLIAYMAGLAPGYDIVVPSFAGQVEPLHAVYSSRLIPDMEAQIRTGNQRVRDLFAGVRARSVTEPEIDRFDPLRKSFRNMNTPQEYKEAACADWEHLS